jgi:Tfp pilus assembly protein PilO
MPGVVGFLKNIPELSMDKSKKKILMLYAVGLLVIIGVFFRFFLQPSLEALFTVIPEIRRIKADAKVVTDDFLFEGKLKTRLQTLQAQLGEYEERLSREKEIPQFLENLSDLARHSRVKIVGIAPSKTGADQGKDVYQVVPIMVYAQSDYHDLGTFINRLENDKRYVQITDMKIRANRQNPMKHDIEFVIQAYTFKQD